jgi:hypothetical protein
MVVPRVLYRRGRGRVRLRHRRRACGLGQMPRRPKAQVFQDSTNDCCILYQCDHSHRTMTFRTPQRIDFVYLVKQACQGRSGANGHRVPILRFLIHGQLVVRERSLVPDPIWHRSTQRLAGVPRAGRNFTFLKHGGLFEGDFNLRIAARCGRVDHGGYAFKVQSHA